MSRCNIVNGLQHKDYLKRWSRTLHNDHGINSTRKSKCSKSVFTIQGQIYNTIQYPICGYLKQLLLDLKRDLDSNKRRVTSTPQFHQCQAESQNTNKETELIYTTGQMDIIDTYKTFRPASAGYTLFVSSWNLL